MFHRLITYTPNLFWNWRLSRNWAPTYWRVSLPATHSTKPICLHFTSGKEPSSGEVQSVWPQWAFLPIYNVLSYLCNLTLWNAFFMVSCEVSLFSRPSSNNGNSVQLPSDSHRGKPPTPTFLSSVCPFLPAFDHFLQWVFFLIISCSYISHSPVMIHGWAWYILMFVAWMNTWILTELISNSISLN